MVVTSFGIVISCIPPANDTNIFVTFKLHNYIIQEVLYFFKSIHSSHSEVRAI